MDVYLLVMLNIIVDAKSRTKVIIAAKDTFRQDEVILPIL